jgi:hypothetical protein
MITCLERHTEAPSELLAYLIDQRACVAGARWAKDIRTFERAYRLCPDPDWLVWGIQHGGYDDIDRLRLWACWCVRQIWPLIADARSRQAVEIAEAHLRGQSSAEALEEAWKIAAWLGEQSWPSAAAAWAARAAAEAAGPTPTNACVAAAEAATWANNTPETWKACRTAQVRKLREIVGRDGLEVCARLYERYGNQVSADAATLAAP